MNNIDNINECAFINNDIKGLFPRLNQACNILGIVFLVTSLGYVVLRCI